MISQSCISNDVPVLYALYYSIPSKGKDHAHIVRTLMILRDSTRGSQECSRDNIDTDNLRPTKHSYLCTLDKSAKLQPLSNIDQPTKRC